MKKHEKMLVLTVLESAKKFVKERAGDMFPPPDEAIACQLDNIRQATEIVRRTRATSHRAATGR